MSGVRLNGFLASTAVALLLSAGGAFAQSASSPGIDPAASVPDIAQAPPAATDTDKANAAVPAAAILNDPRPSFTKKARRSNSFSFPLPGSAGVFFFSSDIVLPRTIISGLQPQLAIWV